MKRLGLIFILSLGLFGQSIADMGKKKDENSFAAGMGYANIDGESYMVMNIAPDLSLGKFGVGLNLELMFGGPDGFKFRKEAYEGEEGWLRILRYLRWGTKGDEVYAQVGTIDNGTLGNGFLMFHYSNGTDLDRRKIGAVLDLDFEDFGFETIYSSFARPELFGARAYYRPLTRMDIPVINTLEVGATYVTDNNPNPEKHNLGITDYDTEALSSFGFDIGMYLIKSDVFNWKVYYDFGKIVDFGNGSTIGTSIMIPKVAGSLEFGARYERRLLGEQFMPSMFNTNYDFMKADSEFFTSLEKTPALNGNFFELGFNVLNTVYVTGNYQKLDDVEGAAEDQKRKDGIFYSELTIAAEMPFELSARYIKTGAEDFGDVWGFDERSVADFEVGYQINSFLYLTTIYRYNWVRAEQEDGSFKFETQKRIIPSLKFKWAF